MLAAHSPPNTSSHLPLSRPHSSSSSFQSNKRLRYSSATPSPSHTTAKLQSLFHTTSSSGAASPLVLDTSDVPIDNIHLYMPNSFDSYPYSGGLPDAHDNLSMWSAGGGNGVASSMGITSQAQHQRQPSTSSIGSTASVVSSPFQVQAPRGRGSQFGGKSANISHGSQRNQSSTRSHLPTPQQTPTRSSFLPQSYPQNLSQAEQATLLMNQALLGHNQHGNDEVPHMSQSSRPNFSHAGQASSTPMATVGDRHDEGQHIINNDSMTGPLIPKFHRTVTDAYQDNLFFNQPAVSSQQPPNTAYLMPTNTMVNDRLLEAQMARSQSSGSNQSAPMSPFRYGRTDNDQQDMKYQLSPHTDSEPKTISPKDAVIDYNAASNDYPLFPQSTADMSNSYTAVASSQRRNQQYNDSNGMDFNNQSWASNMQPFTAAPMQSFNSFATPALPSNMNIGNMSGYMGNSMSQPTRGTPRQAERTPEFSPAQLTRMESSASEAPQSSQASSAQIVTSPKPDSSADSGTYSCTYHGCIQRFTTPQKLQKHKRDAHRNNPHVTPGVGSGMSTAQLMERNSQTGPHICGRTNPTTGKPCDAVFSRPYDLTRHEDTIHNIRKQKVRCAICTEEKTFSRSDALTRHMRVVHPEVDFPGKHRKRGSRDE